MKNRLQFQILVILLGLLLAPSFTYAAWWNPLTWFKKPVAPPVAKVVQLATTTPQTKPVVITPTIPVVKKTTPTTVVNPMVTSPPKAVDQSAEIEKLRKEVEELKKSQTVTPTVSANATTVPTAVSAPVRLPMPATPTAKNYYIESKSRIRMLITVEKSYESWLENTEGQFRSAILTLAGYSAGGLLGEVRDASIKLGQANVEIISSQLANVRKWISYYEGMLDFLNSDPAGFLDEASFNKIRTPESLELELAGIKKDINLKLDGIMDSLRYH